MCPACFDTLTSLSDCVATMGSALSHILSSPFEKACQSDPLSTAVRKTLNGHPQCLQVGPMPIQKSVCVAMLPTSGIKNRTPKSSYM